MAVKRYDGSQWVTVAGKGDQGTSSSIATWVKTAAGSETSLSGNDDNSQPLSYTVGQELVFINGTLLKRGSDYTATTGNSITGLTALAANDVVTVWTVNAFSVTGAIANTIVDAKGDLIVATGADTPGILTAGTTGQVLTVDSTTGTGLKWAAASSGAMTQIADTTVSGSAAANITFSSIPTTYNHLMVVISGRTNSVGENGTSLSVQLNGDTGSNYAYARNTKYATTGGTVTIEGGSSQTALLLGNLWAGKLTSTFVASANMIFPDYKSTTNHKTMIFHGGALTDAPGAGSGFARWQNTAAINEIKIFSTSNLDIGTRATLYGWS